MVAILKNEIEEVFLRWGQMPLGTNPDAQPSLDEVTIHRSGISKSLLGCLEADDVFSLKGSYGDPTAGDPDVFEFLPVTTTIGETIEIEVFNLAILMCFGNTEETRRLFRIIVTAQVAS